MDRSMSLGRGSLFTRHLVVVSTWFDDLPVDPGAWQAAKNASYEVRMGAVDLLDLNDWRKCVTALYAAAGGHIDDRMIRLVRLVRRASKMSDAGLIVDAFHVARPSLGYVGGQILETLDAVLSGASPESIRSRMRTIAIHCSLVTRYGFAAETDLWLVLNSGRASFDAASAPNVLRYWALLVNRKGHCFVLPQDRNTSSILSWARAELSEASQAEGREAPLGCAVKDATGHVSLTWSACDGACGFTVVLWMGEGGTPAAVDISWRSLPERSARLSSIHDLLVLPGCKELRSLG